MLCVSLRGPSLDEVKEQLHLARPFADRMEFRLDLMEPFPLPVLEALTRQCDRPVIYTLRAQRQGGSFQGSETERLEKLRQLAALTPAFLDLEFDVPDSLMETLRRLHPTVRLLLSFHDFEKTPHSLPPLLKSMQQRHAHEYKIATQVHSSLDSLRLLQLLKESSVPLTAIGMGEDGEVTRILAPIFGGSMTYACTDSNHATAPGQLSAQTLARQYHFHSLNRFTAIYGLIGNPVSHSLSRTTHNALLQALGQNAVYVTTRVRPEELEAFLPLAISLGWQGLSVTMPLKEAVMPFLDEVEPTAQQIEAVNTLVFRQGKRFGYNTDAPGALQAILDIMPIRGKTVVLLGAGGAAKAIAFALQKEGVRLVILNRSRDKALALASRLHCQGGGLDDLENVAYDLLINATASRLPINPAFLRPKTTVMDIASRPMETSLLKEARQRDCTTLPGYKMFVHQAVAQFRLWFSDTTNPRRMQEILEKRCQEEASS